MPASTTYRSTWKTIAAFALFGFATPGFSQNGPKNLVSPTYRSPAVQVAASHELTKKELKRLAAAAESRVDHLKLAAYYKNEADRLDGQAAGYEQAAATIRRGPYVKNLMAPSTPGRYEFLAKGFREEARSNRLLAADHERIANEMVAN